MVIPVVSVSSGCSLFSRAFIITSKIFGLCIHFFFTKFFKPSYFFGTLFSALFFLHSDGTVRKPVLLLIDVTFKPAYGERVRSYPGHLLR